MDQIEAAPEFHLSAAQRRAGLPGLGRYTPEALKVGISMSPRLGVVPGAYHLSRGLPIFHVPCRHIYYPHLMVLSEASAITGALHGLGDLCEHVHRLFRKA